VPSFFRRRNEDWPHFLENALRAHYLYTTDKEYVVEGDEVIIVDEFTGRKMHGRRWSDGLHQAVETKEGLKPKQENQTPRDDHLPELLPHVRQARGMTGTAITEAGEFHKIYTLDVIQVPTNLPLAARGQRRHRLPHRAREVEGDHERARGRARKGPAGSRRHDVDREVRAPQQAPAAARHPARGPERQEPRARGAHHRRAGEKGAVTVATNMAGRGTDIKLGGNFEYRLNAGAREGRPAPGRPREAGRDRRDPPARARAVRRDESEVLELGGLYVLGTERHEARRIDNQLRGRSGRQGNVGRVALLPVARGRPDARSSTATGSRTRWRAWA
jgi:preprotein translocase subunit SecA